MCYNTLTAPHIEDLVMLPTPVLRLLNVLDEDYLENEEEYEGKWPALPCPCTPHPSLSCFPTGLPTSSGVEEEGHSLVGS